MLLIVATLPFHAFLGVTIMDSGGSSPSPGTPGSAMDRWEAWLPSMAADQHLAGGLLWASGDAVGMVFFAVLFSRWVRDSMREAAREDRRLDREEARAAREAASASRGAVAGWTGHAGGSGRAVASPS
ncbi:MAG: cytochrome c oxidase assembly protein [Nocardioides sp.]